jgi:hypothetical protein
LLIIGIAAGILFEEYHHNINSITIINPSTIFSDDDDNIDGNSSSANVIKTLQSPSTTTNTYHHERNDNVYHNNNNDGSSSDIDSNLDSDTSSSVTVVDAADKKLHQPQTQTLETTSRHQPQLSGFVTNNARREGISLNRIQQVALQQAEGTFPLSATIPATTTTCDHDGYGLNSALLGGHAAFVARNILKATSNTRTNNHKLSNTRGIKCKSKTKIQLLQKQGENIEKKLTKKKIFAIPTTPTANIDMSVYKKRRKKLRKTKFTSATATATATSTLKIND